MKSPTLRIVCGIVLAVLTLASAVLAIGGIWGTVPGDTAFQLLATFLTVACAAVGVTYIADKFL